MTTFNLRTSILCLAVITLLCGCSTLGPPSVERDRIKYNDSLSTSWKEQILQNIVHIRYVEPLFFTDVGEIVAAYTLETGVNVGGSRNFFERVGSMDFGGSSRFTDRPTITYRPLTGTSFFKGVMSPMPLQNILLRIETGASAAFVFGLGLRSINGLRNEHLANRQYQPADPGFVRAVALMTELQADNALHIFTPPFPPGKERRMYLELGAPAASAKTRARITELQEVLDLDPKKQRYALGLGSLPRGRGSVTMQTCSLAQILAFVASRVDIPQEDVAMQRATPGFPVAGQDSLFGATMVRSSRLKPKNAFAAIKSRGVWFWVDDHDLLAKKVFSFIMMAFTMMDSGEQDTQLQLTLPAH